MIMPLANSHTDPIFVRTNTDCDVVLREYESVVDNGILSFYEVASGGSRIA